MWWWLIVSVGLLLHLIAILYLIPVRYRGYQLQHPWTFVERLKEVSIGWWAPAFMAGIFYVIAVFAAEVYGLAVGKSDYWWTFLRQWWALGLFFAVNGIISSLENRLYELHRETYSFKEVVIQLLCQSPGADIEASSSIPSLD